MCAASYVPVKFQCFILLLWLQVASSEIPTNTSRPITKHGCPDQCGNVSIPYPFGIGDGCYMDAYFVIYCSDSHLISTKPKYGGYNISEISISDGEMTADVYIATDCSDDTKVESHDASGGLGKFTFSTTKNKFIAIGCDTKAYLGQDGDVGTGCMSVCNTANDISTDGSCSGIGCCKASIPAGITFYNATVDSMSGTRKNFDFNPCSYAFLVEESSFNFSKSYLKDFKNNGSEMVPVVVDWTIGDETCEIAERYTSYACGPHSKCISSATAQGYRCICASGYEGNPYLDSSTGGHCQDIDECQNINLQDELCARPGRSCNNTVGGHICPCKSGYIENGKECIRPIPNQSMIAVGACIALVVSLVASFWLYWGYRKRKHMQIKEEFFKQNGGLILNRLLDERAEDIESSRSGRSGGKKHRSIATIYTEKELSKATNNYHESQILGRGGFGTVYKGILSNGTVVAIKKTKIADRNQNEQFINEIAVLSQINHKNVVQLLGCCLESEVPLLVYEFVTNGTLHQHLHEGCEKTGFATLSWENRLRIALEVAGALSYLHDEASIPIIHRDVKSSNVLLDGDYKAKVSDFGAARLNPTDQAQLSTVVQGTFGYLDPEYMLSNQLTEKSDVYSFGVLLVELLTGKAVFSPHRVEEERNLANYFLSSLKTNRLFVILDGDMVKYDNERISSVHGHQQIQQMAELAQKCLRMKGEHRPSMKEVAMLLHGLMMMISSTQPGVMDHEDMFMKTSKEEHMLLSESEKLIFYTDSITTIGDSSKGMLALETEGR